MKFRFLPIIVILLCGCAAEFGSAPKPAAAFDRVSILLFGDAGYDYAWMDREEYDQRLTGREFVINELDDWIGDKRPIGEFRIPPIHRIDETGGYVTASGMWPVARAEQSWCEPEDRCDFGVMLGDNVYEAGPQLGADGRDDAKRLDDLLRQPYLGLLLQNPDFVIYPVLGNHDWDTSRESAMAEVAWLEQSPLYRMDGIFYAMTPAPGVELFAIDTTVLLAAETVYEDAVAADGTPLATGVEDRDEPWSEPVGDERQMLEWLERALAASNARWKIVTGHHPLWSSSGTKQEESKVLRRLLLPILCKYADAYVSGHDHTLELHSDDCRTEGEAYRDVPPLIALVSGAASKQRPLHTPFMAWRDHNFPQQTTWYAEGLVWGFAEMQLAVDSATVKIVSTPNSGSGELQLEYVHAFERRSGRSGTAD